MEGYIKTYRKLMDSAVWQDPHYLKMWMYCLMKATHKERELLVGNQLVELSPGDFVTGRKSLADDLNKGMKPSLQLSEKTWYRYLESLEKFGMLTIKKTNKYSVVSVVNWSLYQGSDQQMTNKCPSTDQQLSTNKNVKNDKNVKKNTSSQKFKYEHSDMELAELLFNYIQDNGDKSYHLKNSDLDSWANTIRLMRERDNRNYEQIKYMIDWTQNHEFWKTVILSASKLRQQFNQLILKVKAEKKKNNVVPIKQQPQGRAIPSDYIIDRSAGEDW